MSKKTKRRPRPKRTPPKPPAARPPQCPACHRHKAMRAIKPTDNDVMMECMYCRAHYPLSRLTA